MRIKPLAVAIATLAPLTAAAQDAGSILEAVEPYGLFKPFLSFDENDKILVSQSTNRVGVRVDEPFADKVRAFGQAEFGINLVNNNRNTNDVNVAQVGDGGQRRGQVSVDFPVFTRLGYVALIPTWGSFSIGKQWGVYYDVAGFTDWFPLNGGEASGTYTGGTDGGVTGTGRAAQAFQFRTSPLDINIGVQFQFRSVDEMGSVKDKDGPDTWSGSVTYNIKISEDMNLVVGGAYTRTQDGAGSPDDVDYARDIALRNSNAAVFGLDFYYRQFRIAATYAYLDKTELDDNGFPVRANGWELYSRYTLNDSWYVYGGFNYLDPDDYNIHVRDPDDGNRFVDTGETSEFELLYAILGGSYQFAKTSAAYIELKLEDSSSSFDRQSTFRPSSIAFGFEFAFGY